MPMLIIGANDYIVPVLDATKPPDGAPARQVKFLGTGTFISRNQFITCAHVMRASVEIPTVAYINLGDMTRTSFWKIENCVFHPDKDIDLAICRVNTNGQLRFRHFQIYGGSIVLGMEVWNYSYVNDPRPEYNCAITPRVHLGYVMRESVDRSNNKTRFIEVNFPVVCGMSGSPIINRVDNRLIGIMYQNYRSEVLQDEFTEHISESNGSTRTEIERQVRVNEYGMAISIVAYRDFIMNALRQRDDD